MTDHEKIVSYLENLLYSFHKPDMSMVVASAFNIDAASAVETNTKFMILGALLVTGKFEEFVQLSQRLDFSDVTQNERATLAKYIFGSFSGPLLTNAKIASEPAAAILQLLIAISPDVVLSHKIERESFTHNGLIRLDYAKAVNPAVRGAVFTRETQFGPGTRKNEFGYRIQSSIASQGWDVALLPEQEIFCYSSSGMKDFALVDLIAFRQQPLDLICTTLSSLRRHFRKIILMDLDPWTGEYDEMLRSIGDYNDYIWGFTPDWCLLHEPSYRGKGILFPNVGGFECLDHGEGVDLDRHRCSFNFIGSVQGYNLNRVYWILESIRLNLPIEMTVTRPGLDDGLDCESSLRLYIRKLASAHASLNLSTRMDGSRMLTGRTVEIISLKRLLIQEYCPALHQYYVEGEHFLEFSDIEGLSTIVEFLKCHPKVAQGISSQGHQFYLERYSCRKLVEHIQTLL